MRGWTHVLLGGAAAVVAAGLVTLAVNSFAGGGGVERASMNRTPTARPRVQSASLPAAPKAKTKSRARRVRTPPRPPRIVRVALPEAGAHTKPWRTDGSSLVARVHGRWLAVYPRPRAPHPALLLRNPDAVGSPRVLLVASRRQRWVRVFLPNRPDGRTGWVRARAVKLLTNRYRVVVRLARHRLELHEGNRIVLRATTVVGKPSTPTPRGLFFIVDLLRPPDVRGAYGPFAYNLSAHSRVLTHFAGGDGVVAIHGTNQPWLLGLSASHGCIRVNNATIRRLAELLPLGTPVLIRT